MGGMDATKPEPVPDDVVRAAASGPEGLAGLPFTVGDLAREVLALREMVRAFVEREVEMHSSSDQPFSVDWALVNQARALLPADPVERKA